MIGDQADIASRLRAVLPTKWFADYAPILEAILDGLAASWNLIFDILTYVEAQTRITSSQDVWLDVTANDFFGSNLARRPSEADSSFGVRIRREILRLRGTRAAVTSVLLDLTGRKPIIFEPTCAGDTGGYGSRTNPVVALGYGAAGAWGSVALPYQCFVTAFRPAGNGVAYASGWDSAGGGYGRGSMLYASLSMFESQVADADIYAAVANTVPAACMAWVRIFD